MRLLVAGYLSNKPNRIIATLDNLGSQLGMYLIMKSRLVLILMSMISNFLSFQK